VFPAPLHPLEKWVGRMNAAFNAKGDHLWSVDFGLDDRPRILETASSIKQSSWSSTMVVDISRCRNEPLGPLGHQPRLPVSIMSLLYLFYRLYRPVLASESTTALDAGQIVLTTEPISPHFSHISSFETSGSRNDFAVRLLKPRLTQGRSFHKSKLTIYLDVGLPS
jgi:hypothetical protein